MAEFVPFEKPDQDNIALNPADIKRRQEEITENGKGLMTTCVKALPELITAGIMIESKRTETHRFFSPTEGPVSGGWREVAIPGRPGVTLVRTFVAIPKDRQVGGSGFAQVEMADRSMLGAMTLAGSERDMVRTDIDDNKKAHVTGQFSGTSFAVDQPNPNSLQADLTAAQSLIDDAHVGLNGLLEGPATPAVGGGDFVPFGQIPQ